MRALLVVNPNATTVSGHMRNVIVHALSSDLQLDVVSTKARGHAVELARQAAEDGIGLVVAFGGDGTVNEVVNGLLAEGPRPGLPRLAVVPGGSTNVFARSLGLTDDPVEATGQILDALTDGSSRTVGLGRADERWFTFSAGMGLDAEVVGRVEERRANGASSSASLYLTTTVRHFFSGTDRKQAPMTISAEGLEPVEGVFLAIVSNTSPWTYWGHRAIDPVPAASFDTGLDVASLRSLRLLPTLRQGTRLLTGRGFAGKDVETLHDLDEVVITSSRPVALQVDGDHLGDRERVTFRAARDALTVVV